MGTSEKEPNYRPPVQVANTGKSGSQGYGSGVQSIRLLLPVLGPRALWSQGRGHSRDTFLLSAQTLDGSVGSWAIRGSYLVLLVDAKLLLFRYSRFFL
jgi:hypothetical protein